MAGLLFPFQGITFVCTLVSVAATAAAYNASAAHIPTAQLMFPVEVPRGLKTGDTFQVQTPDGQVFSVAVSPQLRPGSMVNIPYTPRTSASSAPLMRAHQTQLTPTMRDNDAFLSESNRNLNTGELSEELDQLKRKLKILNEKTARIKHQMGNNKHIARTVDATEDEYAAPELHVNTVDTPSHKKPAATRKHIERKLADFFGHLEDEAEEAAIKHPGPQAVPAKVISIAPPVEEIEDMATYSEEIAEISPESLSPTAAYVKPPEDIYSRSRQIQRSPRGLQTFGPRITTNSALPIDHLHTVGEMQHKIVSGDLHAEHQQFTKNLLNGINSINQGVQEGLKYKRQRFRKGEKVRVRSKNNRDVWYTGVVTEIFDRPGVVNDVPVPAGVIQVMTQEGVRLISRDDFYKLLQKIETDPEAVKAQTVKEAMHIFSNLAKETLKGAESDVTRGIAVEDPLHEVTEIQNTILKGQDRTKPDDQTSRSLNAIKDMILNHQSSQQQPKDDPMPLELMKPALHKMQPLEHSGTKKVLKGLKKKLNPGMEQELKQEKRQKKVRQAMRMGKVIKEDDIVRLSKPLPKKILQGRAGMLPMKIIPTIELSQLRNL